MNWDRLEDLKNEVGDDALAEVVEVFLQETDEVATRLENACAHAEDMHMLKGAALNLGLDELAELCTDAERRAVASPVDPAMVLACYRSSRAELASGAARYGYTMPPAFK